MLIYKPQARNKRDLSNTKQLFDEGYRFGGFSVPIRPDELRLSLFIRTFFGEDDKYNSICDKYSIYSKYVDYLEKFCYHMMDKIRYIRFDIGLRSNIKNIVYYNIYFQHKIKFICKNTSNRRLLITINRESYNIGRNFVVMEYLDYKTASYCKYENFIISHIAIVRNKLGSSNDIQRDENINRFLKVNWVADRNGLFMECCEKGYRIASIRMKHPILTVDNYEKIDNLSNLLYDD